MKYEKREMSKYIILSNFDMRLTINKIYFNKQYNYRILLPFESFFDIAITEKQYKELLKDLPVFNDSLKRLNFIDQKMDIIKIYK